MANCYESSILEEEIAVLQSIYMDELVITGPLERPNQIKILLHPFTADEEDKKFVCLELSVTLDEKYPTIKPSFEIRNARGISEAQVESILVNLIALATQRIGEAMLFKLIEYAKDCLTDNNRPECDCAICLDHFESDENFFRSQCYHYFHLVCLAQYVHNNNKDAEEENRNIKPKDKAIRKSTIPCPICRAEINRELIQLNEIDLKSAPTEKVKIKLSHEFLKWREDMKQIYLRQQKRGGIIDIEAERNKYLIQTKGKKDIDISKVGNQKTANSQFIPNNNFADIEKRASDFEHDRPVEERQMNTGLKTSEKAGFSQRHYLASYRTTRRVEGQQNGPSIPLSQTKERTTRRVEGQQNGPSIPLSQTKERTTRRVEGQQNGPSIPLSQTKEKTTRRVEGQQNGPSIPLSQTKERTKDSEKRFKPRVRISHMNPSRVSSSRAKKEDVDNKPRIGNRNGVGSRSADTEQKIQKNEIKAGRDSEILENEFQSSMSVEKIKPRPPPGFKPLS